jgi:hypothetical protein
MAPDPPTRFASPLDAERSRIYRVLPTCSGDLRCCGTAPSPDNASRNNDPMLMQIPVSSESKEAWADFLNDVTNTRRNLPLLVPQDER